MKLKLKLLTVLAISTTLACGVCSPQYYYNSSCSMVSYALSQEVYDTVLQQNADKINNRLPEDITYYGSEFMVDYVVYPNAEYSSVSDTIQRVKELSDSICNGISDDYSKMKAIHDYVCQTISYDLDAYEDVADLNTVSLKHILDTNRTICAGYSNLFSALCNAQDIFCINVRGSALENGVVDSNSIATDSSPTNHEWNACWYASENRWVYVDCTWDSQNRYSNGEFSIKGYSSTYFDTPVETLSNTRKAKLVDYRNFKDAINYYPTTQPVTQATTNSIKSVDSKSSNQTTTTMDTTTSTTSSSTTTTTSTEVSTVQTLNTSENTSDSTKLGLLVGMVVSAFSVVTYTLKKH